MFVLLFGTLLCVLGAAIFYLGSPNQQWTDKRLLPFSLSFGLTLLLCAVAGFLFHQKLSGLSAIFSVLTLQMFFLGLIPLFTRLPAPVTNAMKMKSSLRRSSYHALHRPHWVVKTLGGLIWGFPVALLLSGNIGFLVGDTVPLDVRTQFVMWLIVPFWLLPISLIYFSPKPWRVIAVLTGMSILLFGFLNLITGRF